MDILIRDFNGNTLAGLEAIMGRDALAVDAEMRITDEGNLIITVAAVPSLLSDDEWLENENDMLDEAEAYAAEMEAEAYYERMTADDMRANPDWNL